MGRMIKENLNYVLKKQHKHVILVHRDLMPAVKFPFPAQATHDHKRLCCRQSKS